MIKPIPSSSSLSDTTKYAVKKVDMNPYDYVNLPRDANTYDQQRDCKLRNCIIEAIAWYVQVLKSPDAPRNEKRIALRFVAHLVGDIHQPLHAGFAEDRGGNSVEVRFNGRKENLHSLWDTALVQLEQGTRRALLKAVCCTRWGFSGWYGLRTYWETERLLTQIRLLREKGVPLYPASVLKH